VLSWPLEHRLVPRLGMSRFIPPFAHVALLLSLGPVLYIGPKYRLAAAYVSTSLQAEREADPCLEMC